MGKIIYPSTLLDGLVIDVAHLALTFLGGLNEQSDKMEDIVIGHRFVASVVGALLVVLDGSVQIAISRIVHRSFFGEIIRCARDESPGTGRRHA